MVDFRVLVPVLLLLPSCSGDSQRESFTGTPITGYTSFGSTTQTSGTETEGMSESLETSDETGGSDDSDSDDSDSQGTDGTTTSATTGTGGATTDAPNPDGFPNGFECSSPEQCMSGNCFTLPLPLDDLPTGICGVCDADQDCVDAGTGIACSIDVMGMQTTCTNGGVGSFCQSQAGCAEGLFCDDLIDGVALLPKACGECSSDADCPDNTRCTPSINVEQFSGNKFCAAPGSVANDGMCPVGGDNVCASGHCGLVDVGLFEVGVCGACKSDSDCPGTCMPGDFDDGFIGSVCV